MSWRTLLIQNSASLSAEKGQLVCENSSGKHCIPAEDIAVIVLDTPQANITSYAMSLLASHGGVVLFCNEKHMPVGLMLPAYTHSRQAAITGEQIRWSEPFKKRVWQRIVKVKIRGQAQCLKSLGCPNVDTLLSLSGGVLSGDPENIEAQAARIYWKSLFGKVFRRLAFSSEDSDRINSALNYGYAIARSIVARSLVSHGFVPSIGIHHDNQLNAYNLADDLLELLRPLIDHTVFELSRVWDNDNPDLTTMDKQALARVCDMQVLVNNEKHSLLWGVDLVVQSLMVAGKSKNPKEFVPMQLLF